MKNILVIIKIYVRNASKHLPISFKQLQNWHGNKFLMWNDFIKLFDSSDTPETQILICDGLPSIWMTKPLPKFVPSRPLITNLTCPGDNSLYIEWSPPEEFYHGVDSYNLYMKTREQQQWQLREIIVPPVAKHHVEKVRPHTYHQTAFISHPQQSPSIQAPPFWIKKKKT